MKKVLQNKTKTRFISSLLLASILFTLILPASTAFAQTVSPVNDYATDVFNNAASGVLSAASNPDNYSEKDGSSKIDIKANFTFGSQFTGGAGIKDGWKYIYSRTTDSAISSGSYYGPTEEAGSFIATVSDTNGTLIGEPIILPQNEDILSSDKTGDKPNSIAKQIYKYYDNGRGTTANSQTVQTTLDLGKTKVAPGSIIKIDVWFCAQKDAGEPRLGAASDMGYGRVVNDDVKNTTNGSAKKIWNHTRMFYNYPCVTKDDTSAGAYVEGLYYKIGNSFTYKIPATLQDLQIDTNTLVKTQAPTNLGADRAASDILPSCSLTGGLTGKGTFMGCIALFVYYIVFLPASGFAWLMGQIFDFFLGYSISSTAYTQPFIESMWGTLRDIANIFFIVLMIYVALMAVFTGSNNYKKIVGAIIINALLINFSLFFTRVVIDVSNITARLFYAQILVKNNEGPLPAGDSGYKQISAAIISTFNPQKIFQSAFNSATKPDTGRDEKTVSSISTSSTSTFDVSNTKSIESLYTSDPEKYAGYFALVSLFAAVIAFATGLIFWGIAFIFVGRVIGLYVAMVFSPFAFMSRDIPMLKKLEGLSWDGWTGDLVNYAISAPLAVAYLFLVNQISQVPFFAEKGGDGSFFTDILWISIPMLIIYSLMKKGQGLITKFSGDIGKQIQGFANTIGGTAAGVGIGVATGGAAVLGRNGIGRLAKFAQGDAATGRSTVLSNWIDRNQGKNNIIGKLARGTAKTVSDAQKSSFDLRQSETFSNGLNALSGKMGIKVNTDNFATKALGVSKDSLKGGYKEFDKRKQDETTKDINSITTNAKDGTEAKVIWQKATETHLEKNKKSFEADMKKDYAKDAKKAFAADMRLMDTTLKDKSDDDIVGTKTEAEILQERDTKMQEILQARSNKEIQSFGDVVDNATLTQATRQLYAKNIQRSPTQWGKLAQNLGIDGYASGILSTTGLGAFIGGGTIATGAGFAAAGIGSTSYLESESRTTAAGKDLKDRQKLIDRQNEVSEKIKEMVKEIKNDQSDFHDLEIVAQIEKAISAAKDIEYNIADKDLEELQEHYVNIMNEKIRDAQEAKKRLKTKVDKQKAAVEIAKMHKIKNGFSKIKTSRDSIKKDIEEKSKPKDDKSK